MTGQTIQYRKSDQQGRIAQGVQSGQLTARETGNLEHREASVNREEHAMRRAGKGHLTAGDKAALTRRQNRISGSIYRDKHNGAARSLLGSRAEGGCPPASPQRASARWSRPPVAVGSGERSLLC